MKTTSILGLLRVPDAADFMACSCNQVYRLINRGDLPFVMVGDAKRVPVQAVIDYCSPTSNKGKTDEEKA